MARARWSILTLLRCSPGEPPRSTVLIRFLRAEPEGLGRKSEPKPNLDNLSEIAKRVCYITRTRPRWEQTVVSDFPSFDFSKPVFLRELFKHQSNLLLSVRFFYWSLSHCGGSPDPDSCKLLFDALVKARACNAAKNFIKQTGFKPESTSLEKYVICLFKGGLVKDAMEAFRQLKESGVSLKTKTWNVALSGCVKARRTDLVWQLYRDLVASGSLVNMREETVGHLIRAFCIDGEAPKGYELLRLVLEDGIIPKKVAFNRLISAYCEQMNFTRVSELLHIMIEKNCAPNICTYRAVIIGLLEGREADEALRVFNELNDRGYAPDQITYKTMIHHFCKMGRVGEARKLYFEMISKGFKPDEFTMCASRLVPYRKGRVAGGVAGPGGTGRVMGFGGRGTGQTRFCCAP